MLQKQLYEFPTDQKHSPWLRFSSSDRGVAALHILTTSLPPPCSGGHTRLPCAALGYTAPGEMQAEAQHPLLQPVTLTQGLIWINKVEMSSFIYILAPSINYLSLVLSNHSCVLLLHLELIISCPSIDPFC